MTAGLRLAFLPPVVAPAPVPSKLEGMPEPVVAYV